MVRFFMRVILGGKSNKREGPLFVIVVTLVWGSYVIVKTAQGVDMSAVVGLVSATLIAAITAFAGTSTAHHLNPPPEEPEWSPEDERKE